MSFRKYSGCDVNFKARMGLLLVSHNFHFLEVSEVFFPQKLGGMYKILQTTLTRWCQTVFEGCDFDTTFVHFVVAILVDGL